MNAIAIVQRKIILAPATAPATGMTGNLPTAAPAPVTLPKDRLNALKIVVIGDLDAIITSVPTGPGTKVVTVAFAKTPVTVPE